MSANRLEVTRKVTRLEMPTARNFNWGAWIRTRNIPINSRSLAATVVGNPAENPAKMA